MQLFHLPHFRIVLVNLSKDLSSEQNVLMNLFFAAQQIQLEVDIASLSEEVVPILQQAADITQGIHYVVQEPSMLVQQLMVAKCKHNPILMCHLFRSTR